MPAVTQKCDSMYKSINVITVKIAKLKLSVEHFFPAVYNNWTGQVD